MMKQGFSLHLSTISSAPTATQSISRFINEKQIAELLGTSVKTFLPGV